MVRRLALLIVAVAALLAAEPLLHQHPLDFGSNGAATASSCVICAAGVNQLPSVAPSIAAPRVIAYTLLAGVAIAAVSRDVVTLPSRAPPAI
jgi:poly-gamma-glutamate capsule biosynthesis protein CapA/YwtB (metallophosphatase superfamily)